MTCQSLSVVPTTRSGFMQCRSFRIGLGRLCPHRSRTLVLVPLLKFYHGDGILVVEIKQVATCRSNRNIKSILTLQRTTRLVRSILPNAMVCTSIGCDLWQVADIPVRRRVKSRLSDIRCDQGTLILVVWNPQMLTC